jgi:carbon storage regulator CsrA
MLCLSRKAGEQLLLFTQQGTITVALDQATRNRARVSIEAPKEILILRAELLSEDEKRDYLLKAMAAGALPLEELVDVATDAAAALEQSKQFLDPYDVEVGPLIKRLYYVLDKLAEGKYV